MSSLATPERPSRKDLRRKTRRHRRLIGRVARLLARTPSLELPKAAKKVAHLLANLLEAQFVGIYFQRKDLGAIERMAYAVHGRFRLLTDDELKFDDSYDKETRTLMLPPRGNEEPNNCPYFNERRKGLPLNLDSKKIRELKEQYVEIGGVIDNFEAALCTPFSSLIIVQIRLGYRAVGAIRVVNHIDSRTQALSRRPFSEKEDVSHVAFIADILAKPYADYRKTVKLERVRQAKEKIGTAESGADTISACLKCLASAETGFPVAACWVFDADGSYRILDCVTSDASFSPPPEPPSRDAENKWGKSSGLLGVHKELVTLPDGKDAELAVYAHRRDDLRDLASCWLDSIVEPLKSKLHGLQRDSILAHAVADEQIIGESAAMKKVKEDASSVAERNTSVLLLGKTGTGKERVARLIHKLSGRNGEFVGLDCSAIPANLVESELFGHKKGAFCGADADQPGRIRQADKGTLLLDEIQALPLEQQAKLLRALEEREVQPVGPGAKPIEVDIRVLAATSEDLLVLVQEGKFLEALYYRICVFVINLPPLKNRESDIRQLAKHFLEKHAHEEKRPLSFGEGALDLLADHDWPGNVRELKHIIEGAVVRAKRNNVITKERIAEALGQALITKEDRNMGRGDYDRTPLATRKWTALEEAERKCIADVLQTMRWDKPKAMAELGIKKSALNAKIKQYELAPT